MIFRRREYMPLGGGVGSDVAVAVSIGSGREGGRGKSRERWRPKARRSGRCGATSSRRAVGGGYVGLWRVFSEGYTERKGSLGDLLEMERMKAWPAEEARCVHASLEESEVRRRRVEFAKRRWGRTRTGGRRDGQNLRAGRGENPPCGQPRRAKQATPRRSAYILLRCATSAKAFWNSSSRPRPSPRVKDI